MATTSKPESATASRRPPYTPVSDWKPPQGRSDRTPRRASPAEQAQKNYTKDELAVFEAALRLALDDPAIVAPSKDAGSSTDWLREEAMDSLLEARPRERADLRSLLRERHKRFRKVFLMKAKPIGQQRIGLLTARVPYPGMSAEKAESHILHTKDQFIELKHDVEGQATPTENHCRARTRQGTHKQALDYLVESVDKYRVGEGRARLPVTISDIGWQQ